MAKTKTILFLLTLLCSLHALSQIPKMTQEEKERYRKISRASAKVSADNSRTVYHLANSLTKNCETDLEKTRAIFVWIASNITYDMVAFKAGEYPDYNARSVLKNKSGLCEGYARLFHALATEADIKSEIIMQK